MTDLDGRQPGRDASPEIDPPPSTASTGIDDVVGLLNQTAAAIQRHTDNVVPSADERTATMLSDAVFEAIGQVQEAGFAYDARLWGEDDVTEDDEAYLPDETETVLEVIGRWRFAITDTAALHAAAEALESDCVSLDGSPTAALLALMEDVGQRLRHTSDTLVELQSTMSVLQAGDEDLETDAVAVAINTQFGLDNDLA